MQAATLSTSCTATQDRPTGFTSLLKVLKVGLVGRSGLFLCSTTEEVTNVILSPDWPRFPARSSTCQTLRSGTASWTGWVSAF